MIPEIRTAWAVEWHSHNRKDGDTRYLMVGQTSALRLFDTRRLCLAWIEDQHGYIRTRPDLRREPHGWSVPKAVKVKVTITKVART